MPPLPSRTSVGPREVQLKVPELIEGSEGRTASSLKLTRTITLMAAVEPVARASMDSCFHQVLIELAEEEHVEEMKTEAVESDEWRFETETVVSAEEMGRAHGLQGRHGTAGEHSGDCWASKFGQRFRRGRGERSGP
ncbi:hypothetical protein DICSQDRAFT_167726 [Dichomitus squalens LYAD-421 SS1]|uniref:Uncharacterized protein n=1 Tax=Dichomitus squalens TaxID=114155 RepID=A0A4Q9MD73_9APHY|nr:uncharacterized protein DICSQDRAFT_167726 [Dichomitus squalens LYAD-421 SS1]EJF63673.1 hypothetical protein DICSQDRAFT_167726 [Dichomitus squalens LYAD-421 SS1]TBU23932.1 hypothetical protein BD311DRAFT_672885 [Dichomitus squalens]